MAALTEKPDRSQITRALLTLREQILSGQFKAGERMSELPLVERIGVSRTPLRLALAALEHEGLLWSGTDEELAALHAAADLPVPAKAPAKPASGATATTSVAAAEKKEA